MVQGHYTTVNVADEHDHHHVLAGHGAHSQKQAHAALAREDWFHALPHEHQVNVLLEHATGIQQRASGVVRVSTCLPRKLRDAKQFDGDRGRSA
ncbi:MAG TPA: hypothetical protein VJS30_26645 [Paraburkholderia sp.]|nr:hypothetical protein [Paraburkholderia sp.]